MKRLALFLDGTWNAPASATNVYRLHGVVAPTDDAGNPQRAAYYPGVGTHWYDHLRGGVVGKGLAANVLEGYRWLVENHAQDAAGHDHIYLFGFSRGAYTARSVAGMIIKCGLLRPGAAMTPEEIFARYDDGKDRRPIYKLEYLQSLTPAQLASAGEAPLDAAETRLLESSRRVPIHCVAVWDTVGALGIPWTAAPFIGRGKYYFHNPNLSVLIRHAYHALALDEHRAAYKPTLWTRYTPGWPEPTPATPAVEPPPQDVEQRWFCGAHANVGGGYDQDDLLAARPLAWLQEKARGAGLRFTTTLRPDPRELECEPRDSFAEFLAGAYRLARLNRRFQRPVGKGRSEVKGGWSTPIDEWIDASVFERYRRRPGYRPANLEAWAKSRGIDLSIQTESIRA
jgi:uncharacterized protein (DUF2235 family)